MAIIPAAPFVLRDCTLNIKDGATDVGDYQGHVSKAEFAPNASIATWKGLTPTAVVNDLAPVEWVLNLDFAQDWATANSLSQYLLANVGKKVTVALTPKNGAGVKKATATVTILPGSIGGGVGEFATSSVSLPADGTPVLA